MRTAITIAICAHLGLLAGCASYYGNIYEGLKIREATIHPSAEQKPAEKSMSYQEYEAERKKLLENRGKK